MCIYKVIPCLTLVLFSSSKVRGVEQTVTDSSLTGYGYELIAAKLEYLQYKLIEIELNMKEDREIINQKLSHQETLSEGLLWAIDQKLSVAINQMNLAIGYNLTALQSQSNKILSQQTACANHEQMRKEIQMVGSEKNFNLLRTGGNFIGTTKPIRSCKEEPTNRTGKYLIQPTEIEEPFMGQCEETSFGGGWLVIQHRFNGSVDFFRSWIEYRNGFGIVGGEHWLGLEHIHRLTCARTHELLVELKDFAGGYKYARYDAFEIGSEKEQYMLKKLGSCSGTAGDSLKIHQGMKFTTNDRDNDARTSGNCATVYQGAWWYNNCHNANLNGLYKDVVSPEAINWYHYKANRQGLAYSRMLIRET